MEITYLIRKTMSGTDKTTNARVEVQLPTTCTENNYFLTTQQKVVSLKLAGIRS